MSIATSCMQMRHGFDAISPLSAALTIVYFSQVHGRLPHARECHATESHGLLLSRKTYTRAFRVSTFEQVLSAIPDVLSGLSWYTCLGKDCTNRFPKVQSNVRFCESCRKKREHDVDTTWLDAPFVHRTQLRKWGADLLGWEQSIDWG